MMKRKKLNVQGLKVKSFVTELNEVKEFTIKGGTGHESDLDCQDYKSTPDDGCY